MLPTILLQIFLSFLVMVRQNDLITLLLIINAIRPIKKPFLGQAFYHLIMSHMRSVGYSDKVIIDPKVSITLTNNLSVFYLDWWESET